MNFRYKSETCMILVAFERYALFYHMWYVNSFTGVPFLINCFFKTLLLYLTYFKVFVFLTFLVYYLLFVWLLNIIINITIINKKISSLINVPSHTNYHQITKTCAFDGKRCQLSTIQLVHKSPDHGGWAWAKRDRQRYRLGQDTGLTMGPIVLCICRQRGRPNTGVKPHR